MVSGGEWETSLRFSSGQINYLVYSDFCLLLGVLLILVYTQGMKVEIPIVSTKYRGFAATYPIKLMYVSNIPVILASALTANAVFMGQMLLVTT